MPSAVYILGNFDGVHLGHQNLIRASCAFARSQPHKPACLAMTFWPHPQWILKPDKAPPLLLSLDDRKKHLQDAGVDGVVVIPFTRDLADLEWQEFIDSVVLNQKLTPDAIFVGADFRFGKGRRGTADLMKSHLKIKGLEVMIQNKLQNQSTDVSSSRVRDALATGDVSLAQELLGYRFFIRGLVARGDGRGKELGFPTANIVPETIDAGVKVIPSSGVYVTELILGNDRMKSMTNIGRRPTFKDNDSLHIETHVPHQSLDIYGRTVQIEFVKRIRAEMKFPSAEELKKQIAQDQTIADSYWRKPN